jgi:hypothetical protein
MFTSIERGKKVKKMNKKLRATILVAALLSAPMVIGLNSGAFVPRAATPTAATPPRPLTLGSTVNIPPGSVMYIAPNNADSTFAANLQDRMNYVGLFSAPYNLSITTDPSAANFWLVGGADEIYIPDGWIVGTLYVVNPSTKQTLNAYISRAAYPSYDEIYIARKLAQNGILPDVHY